MAAFKLPIESHHALRIFIANRSRAPDLVLRCNRGLEFPVEQTALSKSHMRQLSLPNGCRAAGTATTNFRLFSSASLSRTGKAGEVQHCRLEHARWCWATYWRVRMAVASHRVRSPPSCPRLVRPGAKRCATDSRRWAAGLRKHRFVRRLKNCFYLVALRIEPPASRFPRSTSRLLS